MKNPGTLWARDSFGERKVVWIVPVKPGKSPDTFVRILSPHLSAALKELRPATGGGVIIDNLPENGGRRAYTKIFNASPDGYTFGDFNLDFLMESLTSPLSFDPRRFTYLLRTGASLRVIATRKDSFKNWEEMRQAARKKDIKWASGEFGQTTHRESIMASKTMEIPARLINFPDRAENINGLLKGDAQVGLFYLNDIKALLKAGEFRLLMIFTEISPYAGVPSVSELGYPSLTESIRYQRYLVGPPGIPSDVAASISAAFEKVLAKKEVIDWADRMSLPLLPLYGDEAAKVARQVIDFYSQMTPTVLKYLR